MKDCPCRGTTLARLIQPAIHTILANGPLHGYRIVELVAEVPTLRCGKPDASGVYRALKSMEELGLVASSWDRSDKGPAKRSYELTSAGRECLDMWKQTLTKYRDSIDTLLAHLHHAGKCSKKKSNALRRGSRKESTQ